ncbi:MAG: endonuclease III [Thermovirgaceae bacterium]|nr:endonuclease III [Thermovirgaceae bacterium]
MTPSILPNPDAVRSCLDELEGLWHNGVMGHPPYSDDPLDGLVLTLLSQNTNDKNRDRAFGSLKARFLSWKGVAGATHQEIADAIRTGGIANIKAARILSIMDRIYSRFRDYTLRDLKSWDTERVRAFLEEIPGIGPKTVACVLLFDLGRPAFPVDTHVARISRRLGWAGSGTTPEEIEKILEAVIDEEHYLGDHLNMITHGRHICAARSPLCGNCPLCDRCEYPRERKTS